MGRATSRPASRCESRQSARVASSRLFKLGLLARQFGRLRQQFDQAGRRAATHGTTRQVEIERRGAALAAAEGGVATSAPTREPASGDPAAGRAPGVP